jgi:hypothetical protein
MQAPIIILTMAAVLVVAAGSTSVAQTRDRNERQKPPSGGINVLESATQWESEKAERTEGQPTQGPPPPQPSTAARPSPFDPQIARLTRQLATTREDGIEVPDDPSVLLERMSHYRKLYAVMRERLYVDAVPEPANSEILRFAARWSTLAPMLWAGDRSAVNKAGTQWSEVVPYVRARACPVAAEIPDYIDEKTPLDAPSWACLNDTYFADLTRHEAILNRHLALEREQVLRNVKRAVEDVDEWRRRTKGLRRLAPDSVALRTEFARLVFRVWQAGAIARRDELVRLKNRGPGTPLDGFLAHAPAAAAAASTEPPRGIVVEEDHRVRLTLGRAESSVPVVERRYDRDARGLAQRLHDVYNEYANVEQALDRIAEQYLRDEELRLIDEIDSTGLIDNPRHTDAFREGMARASAKLRAARPARLKLARAEFEAERKRLLDIFATTPEIVSNVRSRGLRD